MKDKKIKPGTEEGEGLLAIIVKMIEAKKIKDKKKPQKSSEDAVPKQDNYSI